MLATYRRGSHVILNIFLTVLSVSCTHTRVRTHVRPKLGPNSQLFLIPKTFSGSRMNWTTTMTLQQLWEADQSCCRLSTLKIHTNVFRQNRTSTLGKGYMLPTLEHPHLLCALKCHMRMVPQWKLPRSLDQRFLCAHRVSTSYQHSGGPLPMLFTPEENLVVGPWASLPIFTTEHLVTLDFKARTPCSQGDALLRGPQ